MSSASTRRQPRRAPPQRAPPSAPPSAPQERPLAACIATPDPEMVLTHAVPHVVVSQVLRPDAAAFIPPESVKIPTTHDAQCCVTTLELQNTWKPVGPAVFIFAHQLPHLTAIDGDKLQGSLDGFKDGVFSKLRRLRLSDCGGVDAAFITALPTVSCALEHLNISGCSTVTADAFQHLTKLRNLRELTLDWCDGVNIEALGHVASVRSLTALSLWGCAGVNAPGLALLSPHASLEQLAISNVDTAGLRNVSTIAKLSRLRLHLRPADRNALSHLVQHATALHDLNMSGCDAVDSEALVCFSTFRQLRALDVSNCRFVTSHGIERLAASLTLTATLQELNLAHCCLNAEFPESVAMLKELRVLDLSNSFIEALEIPHLTKLTKLRKLNLATCPNIDAACLRVIAKLGSLSVLNVLGCPHVDTLALLELPVMKALRTLFVDSEHADVACKLLPFVQVRTSEDG